MTLPEAEQPAIAREVRALRAAIIALYKEYTSIIENELPLTTLALKFCKFQWHGDRRTCTSAVCRRHFSRPTLQSISQIVNRKRLVKITPAQYWKTVKLR
jgi:hypothetical protein